MIQITLDQMQHAAEQRAACPKNRWSGQTARAMLEEIQRVKDKKAREHRARSRAQGGD